MFLFLRVVSFRFSVGAVGTCDKSHYYEPGSRCCENVFLIISSTVNRVSKNEKLSVVRWFPPRIGSGSGLLGLDVGFRRLLLLK